MSPGTRVADYMSVDQVRLKMQMSTGYIKLQKWLVIYNAIIDPRPVSEIAKHTGLSEGSVLRILDEYNQRGPESLDKQLNDSTTIWVGTPPGH